MTPLERYKEALLKAKKIKEESVERAERLHMAKAVHAKELLKIDQDNCNCTDFDREVLYNYHRRTQEVNLTCVSCGKESYE